MRQLPLFQPAAAPGPNAHQRIRAEDAALRRTLTRRASTRLGYTQAAANKRDRYLRKWSPDMAIDYEMGRLLACELRAEFGSLPEWPKDEPDNVLSALLSWRAAHPGQMVTP